MQPITSTQTMKVLKKGRKNIGVFCYLQQFCCQELAEINTSMFSNSFANFITYCAYNAALYSTAKVYTRMAPVHGTRYKAKKTQVCILSVSLTSLRKESSSPKALESTLHNGTTWARQQHLSSAYTAKEYMLRHATHLLRAPWCACACEWTLHNERGFFDCFREHASLDAWQCTQELVAQGALRTARYDCCVQKSGGREAPGWVWLEEEKFLRWWKPHSHFSLSASSSHVRSDQADASVLFECS